MGLYHEKPKFHNYNEIDVNFNPNHDKNCEESFDYDFIDGIILPDVRSNQVKIVMVAQRKNFQRGNPAFDLFYVFVDLDEKNCRLGLNSFDCSLSMKKLSVYRNWFHYEKSSLSKSLRFLDQKSTKFLMPNCPTASLYISTLTEIIPICIENIQQFYKETKISPDLDDCKRKIPKGDAGIWLKIKFLYPRRSKNKLNQFGNKRCRHVWTWGD